MLVRDKQFEKYVCTYTRNLDQMLIRVHMRGKKFEKLHDFTGRTIVICIPSNYKHADNTDDHHQLA